MAAPNKRKRDDTEDNDEHKMFPKSKSRDKQERPHEVTESFHDKATIDFETNIWKSCFKSYELDTIERTNHKDFAKLQHRIRNLRHVKSQKLEKVKPEDVQFLNNHCQANKNDPDWRTATNVPHFFGN